MSKLVKDLVTETLKGDYEGISSACVIDMTGMDVHQQQALRAKVRERGGRVRVIKNSLARRAFVESPLEPLGKTLEGPCALVTSTESVIDVGKALVAAAKEFAELKLKTAIIEGDPELVTVEQLSKMKGKGELLSEISGLVSSPGRAIAGCLRAPGSKIAGCLEAIAEKAA